MSLVSRLPFPPQPGESVRGLLLRVAEDNLCGGAEFQAWLGLPPGALRDSAVATVLIERLGLRAEDLHALGLADREGAPAQHGRSPDVTWTSFSRMRWCPTCLAEASYHRQVWEFDGLEVCPVHRSKLRDRCAECEAAGFSFPYTVWSRTGLAKCSSGHLLRGQSVEPIAECDGAAAVYRACGLRCDGPDLPAAFVGQPMADTLNFLLSLGRLQYNVADRNPAGLTRLQMSKDNRVLEAGVRIAVGWPDTFDRLALEIRRTYNKAGNAQKRYGRLFVLVESGASAPYVGLIRDAFARHLIHHYGDLSIGWPAFLPRNLDVDMAMSSDEVRRLLGVGNSSFRRLVETRLWKEMPVREGGGHSRSDIFALKDKLAETLDRSQANSVLGLSETPHLKLFCKAVSIPSLHWNIHPKGRSPSTRYERAEIDSAIDRILQAGLTAPPTCPVVWKSVADMASNYRVVQFRDVFAAMLSGRLRAWKAFPDKSGLNALVFEEKQVSLLMDELAHPDVSGRMDFDQVCRYLRMAPTVVNSMSRAGLLGERRQGWSTDFSARDVYKAASKYVGDWVLAETRSTSSLLVRTYLQRLGVFAACKSHFPDGSSCSVYRLTQVERVGKRLDSMIASGGKSRSLLKRVVLP